MNSNDPLLVTHQLHSVVSILDKMADEILKNQFHFSYPEFIILLAISCNPNTSQSILTSWTGYTKGLISKKVELFRQKNLATVKASQQDRRQTFVSLTKKGENLLSKINRVLEDRFETIFLPNEKAELSQLNETLGKILTRISN